MESAILKLSGHRNASDFEAAFAEGEAWFPQVCSLKIVRVNKKNTTQAYHPIDLRIVDADRQDLKQSPTASSISLTLSNSRSRVSRVAPAPLLTRVLIPKMVSFQIVPA